MILSRVSNYRLNANSAMKEYDEGPQLKLSKKAEKRKAEKTAYAKLIQRSPNNILQRIETIHKSNQKGSYCSLKVVLGNGNISTQSIHKDRSHCDETLAKFQVHLVILDLVV